MAIFTMRSWFLVYRSQSCVMKVLKWYCTLLSWDSALLAPRWWLRIIIPKGCSHMISKYSPCGNKLGEHWSFAFRNSNFFLDATQLPQGFFFIHLAPFQDMISRTGHEWLRLPGRKGLLAKLVTRQEFRAETEDGEGAMCWWSVVTWKL